YQFFIWSLSTILLGGQMIKHSVISIPKMDCPSEESLIKMRLEPLAGIQNLKFDLGNRTLTVVHESDETQILNALAPLNFGARLVSSQVSTETEQIPLGEDDHTEARVLKQLLAINGAMFVFELGAGLYANSTGLIADSLDMFAD